MGQQKNTQLKAYVRFDGTGRIVPSSLILQRSKPKVGNWQEIDATECCGYVAPTTTTTSSSTSTSTSTTTSTSTSTSTTTSTSTSTSTTTTTTTAAPLIQLGVDAIGACNNWGRVSGDGSTFCSSSTITSTSVPFSDIFGPPGTTATFYASVGGQVREFTNPLAGEFTATALTACTAC